MVVAVDGAVMLAMCAHPGNIINNFQAFKDPNEERVVFKADTYCPAFGKTVAAGNGRVVVSGAGAEYWAVRVRVWG